MDIDKSTVEKITFRTFNIRKYSPSDDDIILKNPYEIAYIIDPPEKLQLLVLDKSKSVFPLIQNPTIKAQLKALEQTYLSNLYETYKCIKNPSKEVNLFVVKRVPSLLGIMKDPGPEVQLAAIKEDGSTIRFVESPTTEMQVESYLKNYSNIKFIKNMTIGFVKWLVDHERYTQEKKMTYQYGIIAQRIIENRLVNRDSDLLSLRYQGVRLVKCRHCGTTNDDRNDVCECGKKII